MHKATLLYSVCHIKKLGILSDQPPPKTTALGGVATGNINAHEAAIVADIISR